MQPGNRIAEVLAAGRRGGTLEQVANNLSDALDLIEQMNLAMVSAAGTIEPLGDIDWHGKWRIQKAMAILANNFDEKTAAAHVAKKL